MNQMPTHAPYALVVDDDPRVRLRACEILEGAGFRTFDVETADDALPLLKTSYEAITLIFTDVEMPGRRDGFALAREVAARWPQISIVVASGRHEPAPGDLPQGATFIRKPFSAEIVHSEVNRLLPDGKKPEPLKRKV